MSKVAAFILNIASTSEKHIIPIISPIISGGAGWISNSPFHACRRHYVDFISDSFGECAELVVLGVISAIFYGCRNLKLPL
jgi:hypothetical protein